jgi:prepilin-type N-terminal cleavage/methylation domain-containing protein/prepilin-type processing-associated H-X9-DG protein
MLDSAKPVSDGKKGFTLIELLVVIAIISVLAAILFPVFARARENARRASCMSNMKQMGLATMMYTQDYDEKYPTTWMITTQPSPDGAAGWPSTAWYWMQLLYPYTKSMQMFHCPSSSSTAVIPLHSNYGASGFIFMDPPYHAALSLAAVEAPATTYMIMDSGDYRVYFDGTTFHVGNYYYFPGQGDGGLSCTGVYASPSYLIPDCKSGRHFGGVNVAFADGHVKWLKSSVLVTEATKLKNGQSNGWDIAD